MLPLSVSIALGFYFVNRSKICATVNKIGDLAGTGNRAGRSYRRWSSETNQLIVAACAKLCSLLGSKAGFHPTKPLLSEFEPVLIALRRTKEKAG